MLVPPAGVELTMSSDASFSGDAQLPNPEQLLLAAASSCQLLSFLAVAARSRIDVLSYEDHAEAIMPEDLKPMRITHIALRPRIVVAAETDLDRVRRLVAQGHDECFVANTLNAEVEIEPTIDYPSGERLID
jgi:organic hydroperoxide reductase OsmC/OhrA